MADPSAGMITADEVEAAVDAFMIGVPGGQFELAESYRLNLKAAVEAHRWSAETWADPSVTERQKRTAVKTALLLAVPSAA